MTALKYQARFSKWFFCWGSALILRSCLARYQFPPFFFSHLYKMPHCYSIIWDKLARQKKILSLSLHKLLNYSRMCPLFRNALKIFEENSFESHLALSIILSVLGTEALWRARRHWLSARQLGCSLFRIYSNLYPVVPWYVV